MCLACNLAGENLHRKTITNIHENIDALASSDTSYSLSAGQIFYGNLGFLGDRDWIQINLNSGESYDFDLTGSPSGDGTLSDPYIRILDLNENLLDFNDDGGIGYESSLFYTAEYTGSHYLSIGSWRDQYTGTYKLATSLNKPIRDYGEFFPNSSITSSTWSGIDSTNDFVKGLMWGCKWGSVNPITRTTELNYFIYNDENTLGDFTAGVLKVEERQAYLDAMEAFSSVGNLDFKEGLTAENSHILWTSLNNNESRGALGWASPPDISNSDNNSYGLPSGLTTQNWSQYSSNSQVNNSNILLPGSFYFITTIHELGHSLGLAHPHDNLFRFPGVSNSSDTGDNELNATPYTVMTYNDVSANNYVPNTYSYSGFLETLGAFDIAAVQYLYGPNISKNIGNNIYPLNESDLNGWNCIWDNGGTDVISAESALTSVTINLNNASLKNELGGGGYISQVGSKSYGYTIAFNSTGNCIIENAIGSDFNDKLIGNNFSNVLSGGDGNDRLFGRRGLDELFGGYSNDRLSGGAHNDLLNGGEGRDTLKGGLGNDSLTGGGGKDKFLLEANKGQDIITDYTSGEDKIKLLGGLAQSDLIIRQVEGDVKINYEGGLLAIIQNTIADDLTFI